MTAINLIDSDNKGGEVANKIIINSYNSIAD